MNIQRIEPASINATTTVPAGVARSRSSEHLHPSGTKGPAISRQFTADPAAESRIRFLEGAEGSSPAQPFTSEDVFKLFDPKKPSRGAKAAGALAVSIAPLGAAVLGAATGVVVGWDSHHPVNTIPLAGRFVGAAKHSARATRDTFMWGKRSIMYHTVTSSLSVRQDSLGRFKEILSYIPADRWTRNPASGHIIVSIGDRRVDVDELVGPRAQPGSLGLQTVAVKARDMALDEEKFRIERSRASIYISNAGDAGAEGLEFLRTLDHLLTILSDSAPRYPTFAQSFGGGHGA